MPLYDAFGGICLRDMPPGLFCLILLDSRPHCLLRSSGFCVFSIFLSCKLWQSSAYNARATQRLQ